MVLEDSEDISQVFERKKWPVVLGDENFIRKLKEKYFKEKRDPQVPESQVLSPEMGSIKKAVCRYYNVDESKLLKSRRGRFNEPRNMAVYLGRMLRNDGLVDLGSEFGLRGYSSASSVVVGMKKQLRKNRRMRKRYEEIEKAVLISQTETPFFHIRGTSSAQMIIDSYKPLTATDMGQEDDVVVRL